MEIIAKSRSKGEAYHHRQLEGSAKKNSHSARMREAMHLEYTMTERMSDVLKILRKQGWACYHLSQGGSLSLFLRPRE